MARAKHRNNSDICADCGAPEPTWASINRAILLCDECCSIHRSLGRHISHIKSLTKGVWNPTLLNMVRTLNDNGANSIWEHSLLDPNNSKINRKKPQPKDSLHPVKADFIKAKHQQLAFILRPPKEELCSEEELSRQLHSSVRTSNLETSLRLLAQGANPNYFYKEKGTTPLHVAAKAGQSLQLELLIANGGNPSTCDVNNQTPAEISKAAGNFEISDRLVECMYEVTDRFFYYLCNKRPDHKSGEHLIIPNWASSLERSEIAFEAKNKLKMLPNHLLEELASDVYDEVDRRETDKHWTSSSTHPEKCTAPFLPVNPQLSSTRNQGRQKLARFSDKEFTILILDIITEASQRHKIASNISLQDSTVSMLRSEQDSKLNSQLSDDEPLYDTVASDDDYAAITDNSGMDNDKLLTPMAKGLPSVVEVLKKQLMLSESTTQDLRDEIKHLKVTVEELSKENRELKNMLKIQMKLQPTQNKIFNGHVNRNEDRENASPLNNRISNPRLSQRPASMYETREGLRISPSWNSNQMKNELEISTRPSQLHSYSAGNWSYEMSSLPSGDEVKRCTDQITKRIQELWRAMQPPIQREAFIPCAEKIRATVTDLTSIFPQNPVNDNIRTALRELNGNTGRLQAECAALQRCTSDVNHMERCLHQVRSSAYDIAKATKLLVTQFPL